MRKCLSFLLCALLLCGLASCAIAQTVSCPEAHITLTVPDSWEVVPLTEADDPELCLLLDSKDLTLAVYVSDARGTVPDAFQVFTEDDTVSSDIVINGMEMTLVAGKTDDGEYRIYTWLDRRNQVEMYFLVTGKSRAAREVMDDVMEDLVFE